MNEKIFKTVSHTAVWNIVMGVVILVTGITSGVLLLVSGAKLLKSKYELMI